LPPVNALSLRIASTTPGAQARRNGEKFLLPLQIKLAKDGDEIVYAILYSRNAITISQHRLLSVCRFVHEVRGKPEGRNSKVLCDPGQQQLGSQLRTTFIGTVLIGPDPKLSRNIVYA